MKNLQMNIRSYFSEDVLGKLRSRFTGEIIFLHDKGQATVSEMREGVGLSRPTAQRDIAYLKKQGWIVFKRYRKKGYFELSMKGMELFKERGESVK